MTIHDDVSTVNGEAPPWFHDSELTRGETEELLLNGSDAFEDGTYLLRRKKRFDPDAPEYILSVIFKSQATHHAIKPTDDGISVNQKVITDVDSGNPATNLFELFEVLSKKPKGWPVTFGAAVHVESGGSGGGGDVQVEEPAANADDAAALSDEQRSELVADHSENPLCVCSWLFALFLVNHVSPLHHTLRTRARAHAVCGTHLLRVDMRRVLAQEV